MALPTDQDRRDGDRRKQHVPLESEDRRKGDRRDEAKPAKPPS
jgi:hypothetical protein